jgi:hypothetical protein
MKATARGKGVPRTDLHIRKTTLDDYGEEREESKGCR